MKVASLILGTASTSLGLLRSRPDPVHDTHMRGGPPGQMVSVCGAQRKIVSPKGRPAQLYLRNLNEFAVGVDQTQANGLIRPDGRQGLAVAAHLGLIGRALPSADVPLKINDP